MPVVRDHDHRALIVLQSQRQRVAHVEIEMIGRLVQQQQIRSLPDQQSQRQPRFFAAGKGRDGLQRPVAGKAEAAEKIAQRLIAGPLIRCLQMAQGTPVRPQLLELVLGEVADGQSLSGSIRPASGGNTPASSLIRVDLPAPLRPSRPSRLPGFITSLTPFQHRLIAITRRDLFKGQQGIGQALRWGKLEIKRRIDMGSGDALHPFQRFDPTLRLPGLGGLGAEAGDEAFQMSDFPLLLVIRRLLQASRAARWSSNAA
jgi:hypothetical protein